MEGDNHGPLGLVLQVSVSNSCVNGCKRPSDVVTVMGLTEIDREMAHGLI